MVEMTGQGVFNLASEHDLLLTCSRASKAKAALMDSSQEVLQ